MPLPREYGSVRSLPNLQSAHQTVASRLVDTHFARLGLVQRWTWDRFIRLANFLEMTPWELASMVMLKHDAVESYKRRSQLPVRNPQPTAFLLTLIESRAMKGWTTDIIENPFPNLSSMCEEASCEAVRARPFGAKKPSQRGKWIRKPKPVLT